MAYFLGLLRVPSENGSDLAELSFFGKSVDKERNGFYRETCYKMFLVAEAAFIELWKSGRTLRRSITFQL